jgi:hypothetical protein
MKSRLQNRASKQTAQLHFEIRAQAATLKFFKARFDESGATGADICAAARGDLRSNVARLNSRVPVPVAGSV